MPPDPQSALTPLTQNVLRQKLDGIVQRMIADGQPDEAIRAVVEDYKGKYYVNQLEEPSLGSLAMTALTQVPKSIASGIGGLIGTAADVAGESRNPIEFGPRLVGRLLIDPMIDQGQQALQAGREGRVSEAVGHGAAALLPAVGPAAAGLGAKIGTGDPTQIAEAVGDVGAMAAAGPAMRLTGQMIGGAGRAVGRRAMPLVRSAVKPTVSELRQQSGASVRGLDAQANRSASLMLRNRFTKPEQAAQRVQQTEQQLQDVLAGVDVPIDTATRVPRYLNKLERSASRQAMPGADVAAIRGAHREVLGGPLAEEIRTPVTVPSPSGLVDDTGRPAMVPAEEISQAMRADIRPTEGLEIARATGRWGNRKAWGELKGAQQEASKATERAIRDSVKEAVPEAVPILQQQSEALQLLPILNRMALREGSRDAVSLPAWAMAAGGSTPVSMLSRAALANLFRNQQLRLGYGAQSAGRSLGSAGQMTQEAAKAALLAQLLGQNSE